MGDLPRNAKIASALKGRHNSPSTEFKKGHPPSRPVGIHPTEETKNKISNTLKDRFRKGIIACGFKKGSIPSNKGKRKWVGQTIQCACGCGIVLIDRDYRGRLRKYLHGHNRSMLGKHLSLNTIERLRELRLKQKLPAEDTAIELKVQNGLMQNGIDFKTHLSLYGICQPDIIILKRKTVIQCDGDYWHSRPDIKHRDGEQDNILRKNGWTVLRFWEHEINQNLDAVISTIMEKMI